MDMMIVFPEYTERLINELEKHDFLVHSFPLDKGQSIYSPGDYIYNQSINELEYELVIDTNIFQSRNQQNHH